MSPRRLIIDPSDESYNRVIRLEGQINIAIELIRFRSRYQETTQDACGSLSVARELYFRVIDYLQDSYLDLGLDLAGGAGNLGGLIEMVNERYFSQIPTAAQEFNTHWPVILWYQKLQCILENENLSIEQALIEGWHLFIDAEQHAAKEKIRGIGEYASLWQELDPDQQAQFLKTFSIDETFLKEWPAQIQTLDLKNPRIEDIEAAGLERVFTDREHRIRLDINHPQVSQPGTQEFSSCSICYRELAKEEVDGSADHKPVETICGHIFGYSCIRNWFEKERNCPMCREDFSFAMMHAASPEELLKSCDRTLDWVQPPIYLQIPSRPHSFVDKLALLFRSPDEIRQRIGIFHVDKQGMAMKLRTLQQLGLYLARDRMQAVLEGDVERFREVVELQVQTFAHYAFHLFSFFAHPNLSF